MAKITYQKVKSLVDNINAANGEDIIVEWSANPRINIKTKRTVSICVSLYLKGSLVIGDSFIDEMKKSLKAFRFAFKKERSYLVLLYDIHTEDFDATHS